MDLIRNTIEGLLYDFPIELMGNYITKDDSIDINEILIDIIKRKDVSFTQTDISLLSEVINDTWCTDAEFGISPETSSLTNRILLLMTEFSKHVLNLADLHNPTVRFNELLRWRTLSLKVGEDILVLPLLARYDTLCRIKRKRFLWPMVLEHDNLRLNAILDEELSDTHSHINAATDVFEFNWLRLMNMPGRKKDKGTFWISSAKKDYDLISRASNNHYPLPCWAVIAATVRAMLWASVTENEDACPITRVMVEEMLESEDSIYNKLESLNPLIATFLENALETSNGIKIDYAIDARDFISDVPSSPYLVHHGERNFLYQWFKSFFDNEHGARENADLMLLYLIIKCKVRREFVQTNNLRGFVNFQDYDHEKVSTLDTEEEKWEKAFREITYRYAVQTSCGDKKRFNLEARVTPNNIRSVRKMNYRQAIFGDSDFLQRNDNPSITLIAHFIKGVDKQKNEFTCRHADLRKTLKKQMNQIINRIGEYSMGNGPHLIGLDAAGSELGCPPEVFAPFFRYAKLHGLTNFTYHVGEDFYDVVDGLRAVDETIHFMNYSAGCRIGHALALGVNPFDFYEERHHYIIIPKQTLLDNLVWLKYTAASNNISLNPETLLLIDCQFSILSSELGYSTISSDMNDYQQSMNMRGDWIDNSEEPKDIGVCYFKWSPITSAAVAPQRVFNLWKHYNHSECCNRNGKKVTVIQVPLSFATDVAKVQESILWNLEKQGIVIETNPTSNLRIGRFNRYDQHPIFHFHSIDEKEGNHSMLVSINTDDKGIFYTSLKNEFSLLAIALRKERNADGTLKWSDLQIENYLKRIVHYGNISRFRQTYIPSGEEVEFESVHNH